MAVPGVWPVLDGEAEVASLGLRLGRRDRPPVESLESLESLEGVRGRSAMAWDGRKPLRHHLRKPGWVIPLQMPRNKGFPWFRSGAGFRPSTVWVARLFVEGALGPQRVVLRMVFRFFWARCPTPNGGPQMVVFLLCSFEISKKEYQLKERHGYAIFLGTLDWWFGARGCED